VGRELPGTDDHRNRRADSDPDHLSRARISPSSAKNEGTMPLWMVKATWREDEADASEQWEVNAESAQDAVKAVATHLRFQPHHVEARRCEPTDVDKALAADLSPGEARRIPQ